MKKVGIVLLAGALLSLSACTPATVSSSLSSLPSESSSSGEAFETDSPIIFNEFDGGESAADRTLEIANISAHPVDLEGYEVAIYHGTDAKPTYFIPLSGSLESQGVYVIASDTSSAAYKAKADLISSNLFNNGTYPMVLLHLTRVVDTLGYPGYQIAWGTKTSMIRKGDFQQGRATFEPDDWIYYAAGTLDYLGTFPSPLMDAEMLVGPHLTAADLAAPFLEGSLGGGGAVEVTVRSYGDGDTTVFNLPSSLSAYQGDSLRYENIDTPETQHPNIDAQPWGYAAADFTNGQLRAATHIMIQSVKGVAVTETYGRLLGFVWITTVANPAPSDYLQLNHEIVVNGFSKVAFSGITTSTMMYQGLSYFSYLVDANNHAAKLGLKVHGETDPNFNYSV